MALRSKIAAFAASLILSGSVFASEAVCPDLGDIQAAGVYMASSIYGNIYAAFSIDQFNTDSTWAFAIGPVVADDEEDAVDNANEILSNMSSPGVLMQDGTDRVCQYDTANPYIYAVAVRGDMVSPNTLKSYLNKAH